MGQLLLGQSALAARPASITEPIEAYAPRRRAALVVGAIMSLQVLFLLVGCDWDLSGDEAEYWAWSRKLDWSYYAKGPLIAWLIRASTEVLGGLSLRITGSLVMAVRLPAVAIGGLSAWGLFRLAELTMGRLRTALIAVLVLPAIPIFALGGVVMTIDTPLVCAWTWAAAWAYKAIDRDDLAGWIVAGFIAALGVLAKYTMVAFPASVGIFLLLSPRHRRRLARPGFWVMTALCLILGLGPILYWNARNGWVAAGQLADRMGLVPRPQRGGALVVLGFLGGEVFALGLIWWFAGVAEVARSIRGLARRETAEADGRLYLLSLWGVVWAACLGAAVLGESEVNWMAPAYVGLTVLIAARVDRVLTRSRRAAGFCVGSWAFCVLFTVGLHHTDWLFPAISRVLPTPSPRCPSPLRIYDPTSRMRGHRRLAEAVREAVDSLRAEGSDPFVLSSTYGMASLLTFYLPGQPETYALAWSYGMGQAPANQHDLWHPNPRNDAQLFLGRPAVVVEDANLPPNYAQALARKGVFGQAETHRVLAIEHGLVVGAWDVSICRDYRGLSRFRQGGVAP